MTILQLLCLLFWSREWLVGLPIVVEWMVGLFFGRGVLFFGRAEHGLEGGFEVLVGLRDTFHLVRKAERW